MPLEIKLNPSFELTTNADNQLLLPLIIVKPIPNSFGNPYLLAIAVTVTGNPPEIVQKINDSFLYYNFQKSPYHLEDKGVSIQNNKPCQLDQPLTSEVNCILQVTIDYLESGDNKQPDQLNRKRATKYCNLIKQQPVIQQPVIQQPVIQQPVIQQPQQEYQGWVAIDFGTCNTTVTFFNTMTPNEQGLILPEEQQNQLIKLLQSWLDNTDNQTSEWTEFIKELREFVDLTITSKNLLKILKYIELILGNRRPDFRAYVSQKLNEIYTETFNVPALSRQSLFPVILETSSKKPEIISVSEVTNLQPLTLLMGARAKQNLNNALSQNNGNYQEVKSRFFHSIKRYLGSNKNFTIYLNNDHKQVSINQLIQAGYQHLLNLIEDYRNDPENRERLGGRNQKLNKVVVTYPTVAPPIVRKEIENSLNSLGITQVQTAYDEAIAVAIFYVWQQFGANLKLGIEAFKTRCQTNGSQWWQNVLVLDIGGGTTDIALINLTLEEINVFSTTEDRGLDGKYYKLTPKILGASGHPQLGGELITLRLFRYLKVAIADCVLTSVQNGDLDSDELVQFIEQDLDEKFKDQENKFKSGSLINPYSEEDPRQDQISSNDRLTTAEKVIHTRWIEQGKSSYLQPFYTLWDYAEEVKLEFGKSQPNLYSISEQKIKDLLTQTGINFTVKNADRLQIFITKEQFEKILNSVIDEAIEIGKGLMETSLNESNLPDKKVDWLILSGKTCNFPQVKEQVYQKFSQSEHFIWNPERITFIPEYTKLATSVGACYAEKLRQLIFAPEQAKQSLREGKYQLQINVKNLLYNLPCSFVLQEPDGDTLIFKVGKKLTQIDPKDEMLKARSTWVGTQLTVLINRQDYQRGTKRYWGGYNGEALAKYLGITDEESWRTQIQVQFEINQKLDIDLLFCRGTNPHYQIDTTLPSLQIKPELIKQTNWQIAVNILENQTVDSKDAKIVFEGSQKTTTFHHFSSDQKSQKSNQGRISISNVNAPQNGKCTFFFRATENDSWGEPIGELALPSRNSDAPCEYHASLDEDGLIRIHQGSIPYCISNNKDCLKTEGLVYRTSLQLEPQDIDIKRDPFSGQH